MYKNIKKATTMDISLGFQEMYNSTSLSKNKTFTLANLCWMK